MDITIQIGDIAEADTEAVVNAANERLAQGSGVCGAIFRMAGADDLRAACGKIGHCDTGSAVITPGFGLQADYIIHAVGPIWNDGGNMERKQLYDCYQAALQLAKENDIHSIAFPVISSGVFGCPKEIAWEIAMEACVDFVRENESYDIKIVFVVRNAEMQRLGMEALFRFG